MKRVIVLAIISMIFFVGSQLQAKKAIQWKQVGQWSIRVDQTLNYGCFLFAAYEGGTILRFGFTDKNNQAYIMIADLNWSSLEEGKDYPLKIQFDAKPAWTGAATGFRMNKNVALLLKIKTSSSSFFSEFARSHVIYISYGGKKVANLKLRGSYAAIKELLNCQLNMKNNKSANSTEKKDPFASSRAPKKVKDPFAQ